MPLEPGARLGRYTVERRHASGGMAELYLARAEGAAGFEKTLLLKVLRPELARQKRFVDLLADEARISALLDHECIVRTFDFEEAEGHRFLVMEYVPGLDLAQILDCLDAADRLMPLALAAYIAMQAARGLAYAHGLVVGERSLGIVHRDVNPHNLMVSIHGEVKILDFGIAKARSRISKTELGELKGKALYMAPEQAHGLAVDARTDLYALGMVLYEMATGVPILRGDSDLEILEAARRPSFPRPSELREDLPPDLEAIILRCLEPSPARRFESAGELEDRLHRHLVQHHPPVRPKDLAALVAPFWEEPGVAAPPRRTAILVHGDAAETLPAGRGLEPEAAPPRQPRRRAWLAPVIAVCLAVAAFFAWLLAFRAPSQTATPKAASPSRLPVVAGDVIDVRPDPPGALVFAAGRLAGRGPTNVAAPNPIDVAVRLPGYAEFSARASARSRKGKPLAATLGTAPAVLRVGNEDPDAVYLVDGRPVEPLDGTVLVPAGLRFLEMRTKTAASSRLVRLAPGSDAPWPPAAR